MDTKSQDYNPLKEKDGKRKKTVWGLREGNKAVHTNQPTKVISIKLMRDTTLKTISLEFLQLNIDSSFGEFIRPKYTTKSNFIVDFLANLQPTPDLGTPEAPYCMSALKWKN